MNLLQRSADTHEMPAMSMIAMYRPFLSAVLIAATGGFSAAVSAELVVRDIGLVLQFQPTDFDYQVDDSTLNRSGSDGFDSGYGLALRGLYSFTGAGDRHGFLMGLGLSYATYAYDPSGGLDTYGVDAAGGYGFAITDRLFVTGLARIGLGYSHLEVPSSASLPSFTADGGYVGYGVELGTGFALTDRWVIAAEVGYRMDSHLMSGTRNTDVTLDVAGATAALSLNWRLSAAPWRLE